jgi:hypothetical protein
MEAREAPRLCSRAKLGGRLSTRRRRRCAEPSLVAALPPTGVKQSWQQCECMRYSADATVPDNAGGNRKAVAGAEVSDGFTRCCDHMKVIFDDAPGRLITSYVAARPSRASTFPVHALNAYQPRLDAGYSAFAIFGSELVGADPDNQPRLVRPLGVGPPGISKNRAAPANHFQWLCQVNRIRS